MSDAPRRRDFLTTAAFATAGVGGLFALWPFIAALGPDQETLARRVTFDTSTLTGNSRVLVEVEKRPIAVFRRAESELVRLRSSDSFDGHAFRDRDSSAPRQPVWAQNWHRSLRPEIMVCDGMCTHGDCVLAQPRSFEPNSISCPCCGSRFDLAGRAYYGPAPSNLLVPPYRFIDATTIEFAVADVMTTRASRAGPL